MPSKEVYILSLDPGNELSAYCLMDSSMKPVVFGKKKNDEVLQELALILALYGDSKEIRVAIEMVASYGMSVGATVFETCVWIGRFTQFFAQEKYDVKYIYRKDEKINICGTMKAKDGNIRQALIDRFGVVGTKKNPGFFYGFKADIWSAYAVGITYHDMFLEQ